MFPILGQAAFRSILMEQREKIVVSGCDNFEKRVPEQGFIESQFVEDLSQGLSLAVGRFDKTG